MYEMTKYMKRNLKVYKGKYQVYRKSQSDSAETEFNVLDSVIIQNKLMQIIEAQ